MGNGELSALRKFFIDYLNGKASRSMAAVSRRSGISENRVRRIVQGECNPSFETVMKMLDGITKPEEAREIIRSDFPEMLPFIDKLWLEETAVSGQSLNEYMSTEVGNYIITMATMTSGVTRGQIVDEYGKAGQRYLEELISNEHLIEKDGVVRYRSRNLTCSDAPTMLRRVRIFAEYLNKYWGKKGSRAYIQAESLSAEGVSAYTKVIDDSWEQLRDIINNPKYHGDIPFFGCFFSSQVTKDNDKGEK